MTGRKIGWGITLLILLDMLSKAAVCHFLAPAGSGPYVYPYGGVPLVESLLGIELSLSYATNKGAAWGHFAEFQHLLVALRIALIGGMAFYLTKYVSHAFQKFSFMLVIAGATGNVLDYFIYGHVVDMIHCVLWGYDFPVFNLADTWISCGVALLFLHTSFFSSDSKPSSAEG